jgi:hypothetical protein
MRQGGRDCADASEQIADETLANVQSAKLVARIEDSRTIQWKDIVGGELPQMRERDWG